MVFGSLDKEVIRKVIHEHREQIRACYETAITRREDLKGKVSVKFTISAEGPFPRQRSSRIPRVISPWRSA